jgi:hypothetical protein
VRVGSDSACARYSDAIAAEPVDEGDLGSPEASYGWPDAHRSTRVVIIVIGLVFLGGGIYRFARRRIPDGAVRFRGTVVDVRKRQSSTGRYRTLYGPVVAFDHPATGRREQVEPSSFGRDTFERGDPIELAYDRQGDRTLVVPKRPLRDAIALPAIGVVLIALQIADWVV